MHGDAVATYLISYVGNAVMNYIELIQGRACLLSFTTGNSRIIISVGNFECINSDTHNTSF